MEAKRKPRAVSKIVSRELISAGSEVRFAPPYTIANAHRLEEWLSALPERRIAIWAQDARKPLQWKGDGKNYSPTGLVRKILAEALGTTPGALRGTMWWSIEGRTLAQLAES